MSDGPHRSLNMSRKWKRVAKWMYNETHSVEQRCEALSEAAAEDWRQQIPKSFPSMIRKILSNGQTELFCNQIVQDLEGLYPQTLGHPHASALLDCVIQAITTTGTLGEDALMIAARNVVREFAERGLCQVVEHYLRESPNNSVAQIKQRTQEALERLDTKAIARRIQGFDMSERRRISIKRKGLDEGVPI